MELTLINPSSYGIGAFSGILGDMTGLSEIAATFLRFYYHSLVSFDHLSAKQMTSQDLRSVEFDSCFIYVQSVDKYC